MVTETYLPGLAALLQSIDERGGGLAGLRVVVVSAEPIADRHRRAFDDTFAIRNCTLVWQGLGDRSLDAFKSLAGEDGSRFSTALQKLAIFGIDEPTVLFLDADLLCLSRIPTDQSAVRNGELVAARDWGFHEPEQIAGEPMVNTGVFFVRPSPALFVSLLNYYTEDPARFRRLGDQVGLNTFFRTSDDRSVRLLSDRWNVLKRRELSDRSAIDDAIFLHFVGRKPWETPRRSDWREWGYGRLDRLWWDFFERSGLRSRIAVPSKRWRGPLAGGFGRFAARSLLSVESLRSRWHPNREQESA